ncbi:unnamed protein product [Acanthoscelides obtectus]|uniref:Uncharacterized protein n=1 Tax=Acanthoscelides obtectus TaxID=200917 RepID=A0A9P0KNL4_ACAOB|nr:unnamed protein product [Acanthoscelides obtectus]CAK1634364.1 hypothetical protein AOBTE_LOCUS8732 [Acanthoscelides obtectus]
MGKPQSQSRSSQRPTGNMGSKISRCKAASIGTSWGHKLALSSPKTPFTGQFIAITRPRCGGVSTQEQRKR